MTHVQLIVGGRTLVDDNFEHCTITRTNPHRWDGPPVPLTIACQIAEANHAADRG